jgi:hypothetical protein
MDPLRNAKRRASARSPGSRRGLCQISLSSLRSGGSRSSNDKGFFSILYRNELRQDLACRKHSFTSGDLELQSPLQRAISCDSALLNRLPAMQLLRGARPAGHTALITGLCAMIQYALQPSMRKEETTFSHMGTRIQVAPILLCKTATTNLAA